MAKPDPYRNPYRMPPQDRMVLSDGMCATLLVGAALAVVLAVGGVLYSYHSPGSSVATTSPPVPTTTGQGP
jgi:hypothetical protein